MLPGYVFLYVERFLPIKLKARARHLYKVLEYERGIAELSGSDADYANWLYRYQGQIRPSKILTLGDQVVAIDGPLKDCTGTILKLDRHKRKAWVEFTFDQQKRMVSLSAEWIEQQKA